MKLVDMDAGSVESSEKTATVLLITSVLYARQGIFSMTLSSDAFLTSNVPRANIRTITMAAVSYVPLFVPPATKRHVTLA